MAKSPKPKKTARKPTAKPPKSARTQKAIAEHFGVSQPEVSEWKRLGAPIIDRSPNDLEHIGFWVRGFKSGKGRLHVGVSDCETEEQRTEKELHAASLRARVKREEAEALRAEHSEQMERLKLEQAKQLVRPIEETERLVAVLGTKIRNFLTAAPHSYAGRIVGVSSHDAAVRALDEIMDDLLAQMESIEVSEDGN